MCGISGIIDFGGSADFSQERLDAFASYNKYRGPDQYGYHTGYNENFRFFLGHHRLSILDLTPTGAQPMCNDMGDVLIIFNGEIFNFSEIRNELERDGVKFRGSSDTEVILRSYETTGIESTLARLEGMFALCIVDVKKATCYIARDVFGKKPLYVYQNNSMLAFSSDIRAFRELEISLTLDVSALSYYFSELATPECNSIFEQVHKLDPGNFITISPSGITKKEFRNLKFNHSHPQPTPGTALETIENLLIQAVKNRLVADVPVVGFLSGGIDSGLIMAIAAMNYGRKISTYTVGYENYPFDERPFAKIVAEKYDTDHNEIVLQPDNISVINSLIEEFGEPFADSSMIPSYYVCSALSDKAKVALSGDGGDELFLGYPTYRQAWNMQRIRNRYHLAAPLTSVVSKVIHHSKLNYLNGILNTTNQVVGSALYRNMGFSASGIDSLFKGDERAKGAMEREFCRVIDQGNNLSDDLFNKIWYGTFKTRLLNDYLVKVDRASMFASVEVRSPFLDDRLMQYACSLDRQLLMPWSQPKFLLKTIAKKYLPEKIISKPKTGFGIPVGGWFRDSWKKRFEETVFESGQKWVDLDYKYIRTLFNEHIAGTRHDDKIWALYVFHHWYSQFVKK